MSTNLDPKDFLHAFHGLAFPASRTQIVNAAKDTGGLNGNVILILEQLPERSYATTRDLADEVQRTYLATNSDGAIQSAAASPISDANKELISAMADPRGGEFEVAAPKAGNPPVEVLGDDAKAQAQLVLARNRKLLDDTAKAGPAGEAEVGVGHSVNSDRSHAGGDYSSD